MYGKYRACTSDMLEIWKLGTFTGTLYTLKNIPRFEYCWRVIRKSLFFSFRHAFRFQAVVARDEFDKIINEKDMIKAKKMLEEKEAQLFHYKNPQPKKCKCRFGFRLALVMLLLQSPHHPEARHLSAKWYPRTGCWITGIRWKKRNTRNFSRAANYARGNLWKCGRSNTAHPKRTTITIKTPC